MSDEKSAFRLPDITYFTKDNSLIKQLILKHGNLTCRNQLTQKMVVDSLQRSDFGFIITTKRAQIGQKKKSKADDYTVNGFVLCFIEHQVILHILLFCTSSQYKGSGSELMDIITRHAYENPDILQITLNALPELEKYYVKHGFEINNVVRLKSGDVKVYQMNKKIIR